MGSHGGKNALEESKVTGIPQIVREKGLRRWIKVALFALCILGMLYQDFLFLLIYLKYPVSLSIEIQYPKGIMMPAMTICTGYTFNKAKYCTINKDHCDDINDTWVVKEPYRNADQNPSREDLLKYGYSWENVEFFVEDFWDKKRFFSREDVYPIQVLDDMGKVTECFVTNHQTFEINRTLQLFPTSGKSIVTLLLSSNTYILDFNEYRFGKKQHHRTFSAHSPFTLSNPYRDGQRVATNTIIIGIMQLSETHLLPAPYRTDCMDYFSLWEKNHSFPLSRSICINRCIYTLVRDQCQCFPLGIVYPSTIRFCGKEDEMCVEKIDTEDCYTSCKPDCISFSYEFRFSPRSFEYRLSYAMRLVTLTDHADDFENITDLTEVNGITRFLASNEKIIYKYQPKHQIIEFFSYMGGFSGIWIGLSVWTLADMFGIFCHRGERTRKRQITTVVVTSLE